MSAPGPMGKAPGTAGEARGFSETLGSLRGLAASTVVLYHGLMIARLGAIDDAHDLPVDWSSPALLVQHALLTLLNGSAAVIVFFVLSGAVLSLSMSREPGLGPSVLAAYYVKRGFRLAPLLAFVAVAAGLLHLHYFGPEEHVFATSWMNWHFKHDPDAAEIALNAIGWSDSLNSPAWTIFVEIVASIVFPVLFVLSGPGTPRLPVLLAFAVLAFLPLPLRGVHMFMVCFYAGALIPHLGAPVAAAFRAWPRWVRIVAVVAALLLLGGFQRFHAPAAFVDPLTVLVNTAAAAFLVTLAYHARDARWLRARIFLFLGEVSYGLYLTHLLVLFVIAHAAAPWFPEPLDPSWAIMANLAFGIAALAATVPVATLLYYGIERPFQAIGRRIARRITEASAKRAQRIASSRPVTSSGPITPSA